MSRSDAELANGHLWQIDIVRLLTFAAVIMVHSLAFTEQPSNTFAAGAMMLLQFGREVFFALTGFVLVHAALTRTTSARSFWRRRLPAVLLPYLAWTAIYYGYSVWGPAHLHPSVSGFWADVVDGNADYHLYFLLVTMQLYLVFPALLAFVRSTRRHVWPVLAGVAVVNVTWLAALQYVRAPAGPAGFFWSHGYELLPTYSIYVLCGCYAALHLPQIQAFVRRRSRALVVAAAAAGAGALAAYVVQLGGRAPRDAAAVLQPAMVLTSAGAVCLLYVAGSRWAAGARRHHAAVRVGSDISFGVYVAHPLILALLTDHGLGNSGQVLPAPVATLIGFAVPLAGAAGLCAILRRTRASLILTGRSQLRQPAGFAIPTLGARRPARLPALAPAREMAQ